MKPSTLLLTTVSLVLAINARAATLYVDVNGTNPIPPYSDWPSAATSIQDAIDIAEPGDLVLVTNGTYQVGGRVVYGALTNRVALTQAVTVQSVNGPAVTVIQGNPVLGDSAVRCAYLTNGATLAGFTLTGGATRSFMSDTFLEQRGGGVWCETNGTAVLFNCVLTGNKAASAGGGAYYGTLRDCTLSGNIASMGDGGGAYNCVLSNCTLTGNSAFIDGGGASYSALDHCVLSGNFAELGGGANYCSLNNCALLTNSTIRFGMGGGAQGGTLNNCVLVGNSAIQDGGGANNATLNNCTLVGNSAYSGGGSYAGTLRNCILYNNSATSIGSNYSGGSLKYCCTAPLPAGLGNITNAPLLVDVSVGGLRLQSNSPCINAGNNAYVTNGTDLDDNPRVVGGTVDIGAYEFQAPASVISYAWLQQRGWPTDGSADFADPDGDGMNNWQEWRAATDPSDAHSLLKMVSVASAAPGVTVKWQSMSTVTYYLQRCSDLSEASFVTAQSNLVGSLTGTSTYTDTNALGPGPFFYRVGVQ